MELVCVHFLWCKGFRAQCPITSATSRWVGQAFKNAAAILYRHSITFQSLPDLCIQGIEFYGEASVNPLRPSRSKDFQRTSLFLFT